MKNISIRPTAWAALVSLSLLCYVFLHMVAFEKTGTCPSSPAKIERVAEHEAVERNKVVLPDVALVKRILNVTKIIVSKD